MDLEAASILRLERLLRDLNKRGIVFATKDSLNQAAYLGQQESQKEIAKQFILRNIYTSRSIKYNKVPNKERDVSSMRSEFGSRLQYMADQEEGVTHTSTGKHGVPVPTPATAGQVGRRTRKRRKALLLSNISILKTKPPRGGWKSKKHEIVGTTRQAVQSGRRIVAMKAYKTMGIWQIKGGRKGGKGYPKGAKFRLLYALDDRSIHVPARPWAQPAMNTVVQKFPALYIRNLKKQLEYSRRKAGI